MDSKAFCFVFMGNLYLCPYINKYIEHIACDYDIIYWNRDGIDENTKARNAFSFDFKLRAGDNKWRKLSGYWAFKKYAQKILKENDYDGVVILQTAAGLLLQQVLKRKYPNRYVLDIRDYTMENNRLFYLIEKKVIENAAMAVISSEGYRDYLPPFDYVVTHNNRILDNEIVHRIRNREKNQRKIIIAFIGFINYQEQHKKLLKLFKNDERFELHFIGKEAEKLIPFCEENKITNVKLVGKFSPEQILDYYTDVDIINNLYGNNTPILDYALSNKLYFAAELGMPILVCKGTFVEEISVSYGFGYTFDFDDSEACNKLYDYYRNIDWELFHNNCDTFLRKVKEENKIFDNKLKGFFKGCIF